VGLKGGKYRGVAQLVEHKFWELGVRVSSTLIPTINMTKRKVDKPLKNKKDDK
jgi:hypothetical protein